MARFPQKMAALIGSIGLVLMISSCDTQPENTVTATLPPPQPTETPFLEATETPPAATSTSEIIDKSSESSTGNAISVTQTVTPAMVPSAGTGDEQWTIAYLDQAPVIDGDINDWPGTIYAIDKVVFGPEFYANQIDLFGEFKFGWDADDLYLGVLVRDSQFVQTSTDALLFQGDSIEVLLDTDWSGDQNSDTLSADDYQIG
ncbi:MAG: sugar-binding protein, partial [Anaerolineales bacterium]